VAAIPAGKSEGFEHARGALIKDGPPIPARLVAMCGRLRVGKSFVDLMHCWSELPCVRPLDAAFDIGRWP
jgi:hypothetical protein